jgi:hypothetical protein
MAKAKETVEGYIAARSPGVGALLEDLRAFVQETLPEAREGMKWGAPVYWNAAGKPVVYLYGGRDHANLGFLHGAGLDDPEGILEGRGVSGRHVKLFPGKALPRAALAALLRQCG